MSKFSMLQATHEKLVKAQSSEDILEQVQQFIKDIQQDSSRVSSTRERDQLRANLRYWASYVYEKTGQYPNTELLPSTEPPGVDRSVIIFSAIGAVIVLLACLLGYFGFVLPQQQAMQANNTVQANLSTQNAQISTSQASLSNTLVPTQTPSTLFIETPIPVTATLAPTEAVVTVQITSVKQDDQVQAITKISGTYSNLIPGSSIHLIIQPLSDTGLYFPMPTYASVSANSTSGEWSIEARFGQGTDLEKSEQYELSVAVAPDQDTRDKLLAAVTSGFQKYPSGVFQFPQKVVVTRPAYTVSIDGVQVIYSSYLEVEGNLEIFAMNLDGTKQSRITYTSGLNEMFPSLSTDGKQIVYVAGKVGKANKLVYSIDVINSDGTNRQELVSEKVVDGVGLIYENPLWSPDGQFIAYSVGTPRADGRSDWNIYVYDMNKKNSFQVTDGQHLTDRYFAWIPKTSDIIFDEVIQNVSIGFVRINIFDPKNKKVFIDEPGDQLQPSISPDGTKLSYMQRDLNNGGAGDIYWVNLAGGKPVRLTKSSFQDEKPVWGPDNATIFYESLEVGYRNIWLVKLDDKRSRQLTFGKTQYPFVGYMYAIIP